MIEMYNALAQDVVDAKTVPDFQRKLISIARIKFYRNDTNWKSFLCARDFDLNRHLRNELFLERHIRR